MMQPIRGLGLAATLVLVSTVAVVPKARAAPTPYTVANVYVQIQGPEGSVYGFSALSNGQLSSISGSPFKPAGKIVGSNKSQIFTLGADLLHSYGIASNGAIQSQLFQEPVLDNAGSSCGAPDGAVLDHTGKVIYVLLQNGGGSCAAYQSYMINNDGSFTFDGDAEENTVGGASVDLPSILGNESYAYADLLAGHSSTPIGFRRGATGTLEPMQFGETDPTPPIGSYVAYRPDASRTGNYLVLQLYPNDLNPPQLGSYTVDSGAPGNAFQVGGTPGDIATTNTSSNMPTSSLDNPYSTFSPSGNMLVLYADNGVGKLGDGIEIYNFNGAAPLTLYKTLLSGTPIDQVAWDSDNHLYAISRLENRLYVFTVTSTSVTQDVSRSIGSPFSMVLVNQPEPSGACPFPSGDGVNVCSPGEHATVSSPVLINAAATVVGGVYRFELWNGNTKLLTERDSPFIDQSVSLAPGTYYLDFSARDSTGDNREYALRTITVQ